MFIVKFSTTLNGIISLPGDKSITHRSIMLASLANGTSFIKGALLANDCLVTLRIMKELGVCIKICEDKSLEILGVGFKGLKESNKNLDCVNSATTMRLLCGILIGQNKKFTLIGSNNLCLRPMDRIIHPLKLMGANIISDNNFAPLRIEKSKKLIGIKYNSKIASAQVKSAILLASLYADAKTNIIDFSSTRNHTELLLKIMGANIIFNNNNIISNPLKKELIPLTINIPGDISSAAFLIAAVSVNPSSTVLIKKVLCNYTRIGIIDALRKMGATINLVNKYFENNELVSDIYVRGAYLRGSIFSGDNIIRMIDELPVLAVVATQAFGVTEIRDASELRVKESDRIEVIVSELKKMGANIRSTNDGFVIIGGYKLLGAKVNSHGDHRIAMALAVAGLFAYNKSYIVNSTVVRDSFPDFILSMNNIGAKIEEVDYD